MGLCGWRVQGLFLHLVLKSPTEDGVSRRASVVVRQRHQTWKKKTSLPTRGEEDLQSVWLLPLSTSLSCDGQRRSFPEMMGVDLTSQRNGSLREHC